MFSVTWIEATGSGDLYFKEVFHSYQAAQAWLNEMRQEDEWGLPPMWDHCTIPQITALESD